MLLHLLLLMLPSVISLLPTTSISVEEVEQEGGFYKRGLYKSFYKSFYKRSQGSMEIKEEEKEDSESSDLVLHFNQLPFLLQTR